MPQRAAGLTEHPAERHINGFQLRQPTRPNGVGQYGKELVLPRIGVTRHPALHTDDNQCVILLLPRAIGFAGRRTRPHRARGRRLPDLPERKFVVALAPTPEDGTRRIGVLEQ